MGIKYITIDTSLKEEYSEEDLYDTIMKLKQAYEVIETIHLIFNIDFEPNNFPFKIQRLELTCLFH